ncbi:MAG: hypothetical protein L6Q57_03360 [Alphaproteobacteria bacterium]|nr:hypothetical protein [Alphaproteobacteria bacterium]
MKTLEDFDCTTQQHILNNGKVFIVGRLKHPETDHVTEFFFSQRIYEAYKRVRDTLQSPQEFGAFLQSVGYYHYVAGNFVPFNVPADDQAAEMPFIDAYMQLPAQKCWALVNQKQQGGSTAPASVSPVPAPQAP